MLRVNRFNTGIIVITLGVMQVFSASAYAETRPDVNLTDWSAQLAQRVNVKMDRKLQQIVMEAQILQNLEQDTQQRLTSLQKEVGCEPGKKISKL